METAMWIALLLVAGFHLGEGAMTIQPTYDTYYLQEGTRLQLACTSDENAPSYSWKKDGSKFTTDVTSNATGIYFTKYLATTSDSGRYDCEDGFSHHISINVKVFMVTTTSGNYTSRSVPITLTCQPAFIGTAPTYTMSWKREDKRDISDTSKYQRNGSSLVITAPSFTSTSDDGGVYYCGFTFDNNAKQEVSVAVYVYAGPLVKSLGKSLTFTESETSYIECSVVSYPKATITWLYENRTITNNRVTFTTFNGYSNGRLEIETSQKSDRGYYTCSAYNSQLDLTNSKTVLLRVKDHLAWLWPLIGIIVEILVLILIMLVANYKCPKTQPTGDDAGRAHNAEPQPGTSRSSPGEVRKRTTNL